MLSSILLSLVMSSATPVESGNALVIEETARRVRISESIEKTARRVRINDSIEKTARRVRI
ncbi:MAG: hypothetical protein ACI9LM_000852 [Alteromonadaceae bacterium]|jgi:hypothetical protein